MVFDYRAAPLSPADRALCDYAVKLTLKPGDMGRRDIELLHAHGFNDRAITIATQVVSYFNYINRVADALGVDEERWMEPSPTEWHSRRGRDYLADM